MSSPVSRRSPETAKAAVLRLLLKVTFLVVKRPHASDRNQLLDPQSTTPVGYEPSSGRFCPARSLKVRVIGPAAGGVIVGSGVRVDVEVDVAVRVLVVAVPVAVRIGVVVQVAVGVSVDAPGVVVPAVPVTTGVRVAVGVGVFVEVGDGVRVSVGSGVLVEVGSGVRVGLGTCVRVGLGTCVRVAVGTGVTVGGALAA
jgi:hypothetical protein